MVLLLLFFLFGLFLVFLAKNLGDLDFGFCLSLAALL